MSSLVSAKGWQWAAGTSSVGRLVAKGQEQASENPLGHPPDDRVIELIRLYLAGLSRHRQANEVVPLGLLEIIYGDPGGGSHLPIQDKSGATWHKEDKRTNCHRRQDRRSRHDILKAAKQLLSPQLESYLLLGFSNGGCEELHILGLTAASRKGHLAGPGISHPIGASDEQDGIGIRSDDDRYCRPDQRIVVNSGRVLFSQAVPEAGDASR